MRIQAIVLGEIHEMLYTRLLARSTSFHNNQVSGKLVSDAIDFVTSYLTLSNVAVNTGVPFLLVILAGLTVVFLSSPILGLYILVVMAVTLIWAYVESRRRFDTRNRRLAAQKRLTAHLADTIVNTQTVKTFARESYEQHTNQSLSHTLRDLRLADWQTTARTGNNRMSLLLVSQLVLLLIVARLSTTNPDILGTGFFAFTYVFVITYRLFDLNTMTRQIEESLLNASRPISRSPRAPLSGTTSIFTTKTPPPTKLSLPGSTFR
jgi:ATP-binding cassette subfamily B protein